MRFSVISLSTVLFALGACDAIKKPQGDTPTPQVAQDMGDVTRPDADTVRPTSRPDQSSADVTQSTAQDASSLGTTIASLGLLDRGGLWMRTPLVSTQTEGRVVVKATGAAVNLILLPLEGDAGAGSQISIAAMQALNVSITDLVPVDVTRL